MLYSVIIKVYNVPVCPPLAAQCSAVEPDLSSPFTDTSSVCVCVCVCTCVYIYTQHCMHACLYMLHVMYMYMYLWT